MSACAVCGGTGAINVEQRMDGYVERAEVKECDECGGRGIAAIVVPDRARDLPPEEADRPCDRCGVRASFHFDGWSGGRLDCAEAQRRHPSPPGTR